VGFPAAQAARLAGCTVSQVRYWARTELVAPTGAERTYEFGDLVALRIVRSLLDAGLPTTRARAAVRSVREISGEQELGGVRLVTDGRQVWCCRDDEEILDALRSGQLALFIAVDDIAATLHAEIHAFAVERAAFVEQLRAETG
jgi:DNA-binding transcriptional MerR regulator